MSTKTPAKELDPFFPLHQDQIDEFLENGVLVVNNVFTPVEIEMANEGMRMTLQKYGVDTHELMKTGHHLKQLSSTNGMCSSIWI